MDFGFAIKSVGLGTGLAMDAFSVSLADGLGEPNMKKRRMCLIAGVFALFQFAMPMIGWICVHTVVNAFGVFEDAIPWIALALLTFIGGKMLWEGVTSKDGEQEPHASGAVALILQGVATSIDALSVGFTISDYDWLMALNCCLIIAAVTFLLCMIGILIGRRFGTKLAGKASILGGVILIAIGIEIFVSGLISA